MKNCIKHFLSSIIIVTIVYSSISLCVSAVDTTECSVAEPEYTEAYIQYLQGIENGDVYEEDDFVPYPYKIAGTTMESGNPECLHTQSLEYSYDPRKNNMVSDIRNQNPWGTCWAMSGISTLESYLIKNSMADNKIDLSEEHLIWWAMKQKDGRGWIKENKNAGGYAVTVTGYYTSWDGVKSEKDIPYDRSYILKRPKNYYSADSLYNVTDVAYINGDINSVKYAIKNYGAVSSMYCHEYKYLSYDEKSYCHSPYTKLDNDGYHAISIVGWSDYYPKHKFTGEYRPSHNGAWLIKNSWGEDFGDGGYMWISYEDPVLIKSSGVNVNYSVKNAKVADTNEKIYQHNPYGSTYPIKLKDPSTSSGRMQELTAANVFDFEENQRTLESVMFMSDVVGQEYDIYYAPVVDNKPITDKNLMTYLQSGVVETSGYTTVNLDNQIKLPAGKGAIVIYLDNNYNQQAASIGAEKDIKYPISKHKYKYQFKAVGERGQSFIILDDEAIDSMDLIEGETLTLTIKAITNNK